MGMIETPSTLLIQLGFTKILFNEPEMPFQNVHHLCLGLKTLTKMVHNFLGHPKLTGLNHMLFEFGHLNASKYFKCPNNPKLKCSMLDIFHTVGMCSLVIFDRV